VLTPAITLRTCFLIFLSLLCLQLPGQTDRSFALQSQSGIRIPVDTTFTGETHIEPFIPSRIINGLVFSGDIVLHSDSSLVRLILIDVHSNEYLIYEAYPILAGSSHFSVYETGEETNLLNPLTPARARIEIVDASIHLKELLLSTEESYDPATKGALALEQNNDKIARINQNIRDRGEHWVAGETSISSLSYQEKKALFGGKIPNLQGFEYYVGGVFVFAGTLKSGTNTKETYADYQAPKISPFPFEFSWQNRHGTSWLTPVKNQGSCGSCWSFAATGVTEQLVNLYYNRHIDYNLSEQYIISCSSGSCSGGSPMDVFDFVQENGIVLEDCFPYLASDADCSLMCEDPEERVRISGWKTVFGEEEKKKILARGVAAGSIGLWQHLVQVAGYKELEPGDNHFVLADEASIVEVNIGPGDPLLGETAWLIKNSWGESWGMDGFGYVVGGKLGVSIFSLEGPASSLVYDERSILCTDSDGDGSYFWGIGPKPPHCPASPDEADGDDSDPCIRAMDEFGKLLSITPGPEVSDTIILFGQPIPDLLASGTDIRWYPDRKFQNPLAMGNHYATGHTEPGNYTYFVTQTLSGCESDVKDITLSIVSGIAPPSGHDTIIALGEPAILSVYGEPGAGFRWYRDPAMQTLLQTGESFKTSDTSPGEYLYYVTQSLDLLESPPDTVSLEISEFVHIPDSAFLMALVAKGVDAYNDHQISYEEAAATTVLQIEDRGIHDMTGIEAFVNLKVLWCRKNELGNLDLSQNTGLKSLDCSENLISSLDASHNPDLELLNCRENQLVNLDVTKNFNLQSLDCQRNQLAELNVTSNCQLNELHCGRNLLSSLSLCSNGHLWKLSLDSMQSLDTAYVWDGFPGSAEFISDQVNLHIIPCHGEQVVFIPDTSFLYALIDLGVDSNGDGMISYTEAEAISYLDVSADIDTVQLENGLYYGPAGPIASMKGIEAFLNLDTLICSGNNLLALDLSHNKKLKFLDCSLMGHPWRRSLEGVYEIERSMLELKVNDCSELSHLQCSQNRLMELRISDCKKLVYLDCSDNFIRQLILHTCQNLSYLNCSNNPIFLLDLSCNTQLASKEESSNGLFMKDMYMLNQVCVWESFHWDSVEQDWTGSADFRFRTRCGACPSWLGTAEEFPREFMVYPNPAHDIIHIEKTDPGPCRLEISSLSGQVIIDEVMTGCILQVDLSCLRTGAYFITMSSQDFVFTKKIIKQ
jgi:Leucine-rich repeat (LRR) protein